MADKTSGDKPLERKFAGIWCLDCQEFVSTLVPHKNSCSKNNSSSFKKNYAPSRLRRSTHANCGKCGTTCEEYGIGYVCWSCNHEQTTHS